MKRGLFLGSMAATGAVKQVGFLGRFFKKPVPVVQPIRWALYRARMRAQVAAYHSSNVLRANEELLNRLNAEMVARRVRGW